MFWNLGKLGKKDDDFVASKMELDVLLSELKSREDFLQSQIKNESTNFLAILSSVAAAATIYASQLLKAQGSGQEIPAPLILGLAVAFLWFPMNHAWHMTESRAAEKYAKDIAQEIRRIVAPSDASKLMTWQQFRLEEIKPSWRTWYVSLPMITRGVLLYIPSISLASYCLWGLNGHGTFQFDSPLHWILLLVTGLGVVISIAALILPYWRFSFRKEMTE